MRLHRSSGLLFPAAVAAVLFLAVDAYADTPGIAWRMDLDAATSEARQSGKVLMVDVYTDWCEWCKVLDTKTYTDPKVITGAQQLHCSQAQS